MACCVCGARTVYPYMLSVLDSSLITAHFCVCHWTFIMPVITCCLYSRYSLLSSTIQLNHSDCNYQLMWLKSLCPIFPTWFSCSPESSCLFDAHVASEDVALFTPPHKITIRCIDTWAIVRVPGETDVWICMVAWFLWLSYSIWCSLLCNVCINMNVLTVLWTNTGP